MTSAGMTTTLGDARKCTQAFANRDDCAWVIYTCRYPGYPYIVADEFQEKPYWAGKQVAVVHPVKRSNEIGEAVYLTPDEKALVDSIGYVDPHSYWRMESLSLDFGRVI